MLLRYCFFFLACASIIKIYSVEYIYPVGSVDNGSIIFLIHQISPYQIELLQWDTHNNKLEQILWSIFNPAGFQLLPSNEGFSFIDKGRLRIKFFNKRSPKAIDFDVPLFNINFLRWIDFNTCYCSAQQDTEYALFYLYDNGSVCCIAACHNKDYMYPQKIDNHFFYIERDKSKAENIIEYRIMHTECLADECEVFNDLSMTNPSINISLSAKMIVDFESQPIIFLNMISDQEGFVIKHQKKIDARNTTMFFSYYHIKKEHDIWNKKKLFSFFIPKTLLAQDNQEALYESIAPLLPQVFGHKIYFVSCLLPDSYNLEPYYYDLKTNMSEKIIVPGKIEGHVFVPVLYGTKVYCGGTKQLQGDPLISFLT